jgi:hypothetical protein
VAAGAAVEAATGEKALFGSLRAFPANGTLYVVRADEDVVVFSLAVALGAAGEGLLSDLRVKRFDHFRILHSSILNQNAVKI